MDVSADTVRAGIAAAGPGAGDSGPSSAGATAAGAATEGTAAPDTAAEAAAAGGAAAGSAPDRGSPPFSGEARQALRDTLAVALEFSHNYIGTEHILLGLYRNPDSLAARILGDAGALEPTARAHVTDLLRGFARGS